MAEELAKQAKTAADNLSKQTEQLSKTEAFKAISQVIPSRLLVIFK